MEAKLPTPATVQRYGLSLAEWQLILARQGGVCYVCRKLPSTGRLCVEHEHVRGWKKLPADQRKLFVRGLCCFGCNTQLLGRGLTLEKARRVVSYLEEYEARKNSEAGPI